MYIDIFVATEVLTDVFCLARKRWEKGKKQQLVITIIITIKMKTVTTPSV